MGRGMFVRVGVGDAYAMIGSEGVSYSPDLAHDMAARAYETFKATIESAVSTGYIDLSPDWDPDYPSILDDDEDEEGLEEEEEEEEFLDGTSSWWIQ